MNNLPIDQNMEEQPMMGMEEQPMMGAGEQPEEEMNMEDMDAFASEIQRKYRKILNNNNLTDLEMKNAKQKMLEDLYNFFREKGIDPMDQNQISAFLADLEEANPEVYDIVIASLDSIMGFVEGGEDEGEMPTGQMPTGQMPSMGANAAPQEGGDILSRFPNLMSK